MRHRLLGAFACVLVVAASIVTGAATAHATVYLTLSEAEAQLLPAHDTLRKDLVSLTDQDVAVLEAELGYRPERDRFIWRVAEHEGRPVGYLLIDNEMGKHEPITFAVALDADGSVRDIAVCVYRETRGDEIRRPTFRKQFVGKKYGDSIRLGRDIVHVSGATISSRSAVTVVARALALWRLRYRGDAEPPEVPRDPS